MPMGLITRPLLFIRVTSLGENIGPKFVLISVIGLISFEVQHMDLSLGRLHLISTLMIFSFFRKKLQLQIMPMTTPHLHVTPLSLSGLRGWRPQTDEVYSSSGALNLLSLSALTSFFRADR